jgi:hypothetical protein
MAATDARFIPIKNAIRRITVVLRDVTSGDPITGATIDSGLASGAGKALVSKDGGAAANSTNSVVEDGSGFYHLDLTATEMNADTVAVRVRTTTANGVDATEVMYTEPRGVRDLAFPAVTGRSLDVDASGRVVVVSLANGSITAAVIATDAIDADAIADNAIDSAAISLAAYGSIGTGVWAKTMTEPSAVPSITGPLFDGLTWLVTLARNKRTQTATTEVLRNDADNANIATSTKSDDGTTFIRGEWA